MIPITVMGRGDARPRLRLASTINHLGRLSFSRSLFEFVAQETGADLCLATDVSKGLPQVLGLGGAKGEHHAISRYRVYEASQCWKFDPVLQAMGRFDGGGPTLLHLPKSMADAASANAIYGHDILDRIVTLATFGGRQIVLALARSNASGLFHDRELEWLDANGPELLSLIARHACLLEQNDRFLRSVTCLAEIENCLEYVPGGLAPREVAVCARLLLGASVPAISAELGIGDETVVTYRKRAYLKLNISAHRELLPWYVRNWLECQSRMISVH